MTPREQIAYLRSERNRGYNEFTDAILAVCDLAERADELQEALDLLDEMAALLDRFSAPQSSKPRERNWRPLSVREARRKLRVLKKRVSGDE